MESRFHLHRILLLFSEAILEHGFDNKPYDAYAYLTQNIDYIFDNQKHKALQKFWDS